MGLLRQFTADFAVLWAARTVKEIELRYSLVSGSPRPAWCSVQSGVAWALPGQAVSHPSDRLQPAGRLGIVPELAPEIADMDLHCAFIGLTDIAAVQGRPSTKGLDKLPS